jgi:hypothetical protein
VSCPSLIPINTSPSPPITATHTTRSTASGTPPPTTSQWSLPRINPSHRAPPPSSALDAGQLQRKAHTEPKTPKPPIFELSSDSDEPLIDKYRKSSTAVPAGRGLSGSDKSAAAPAAGEKRKPPVLSDTPDAAYRAVIRQ